MPPSHTSSRITVFCGLGNPLPRLLKIFDVDIGERFADQPPLSGVEGSAKNAQLANLVHQRLRATGLLDAFHRAPLTAIAPAVAAVFRQVKDRPLSDMPYRFEKYGRYVIDFSALGERFIPFMSVMNTERCKVEDLNQHNIVVTH